MERNTALDRALLYIPWRNDSFQSTYQIARRYLFPQGTVLVKIVDDNEVILMIHTDQDFNWQITAYLL